jgi:hypothetical protein
MIGIVSGPGACPWFAGARAKRGIAPREGPERQAGVAERGGFEPPIQLLGRITI